MVIGLLISTILIFGWGLVIDGVGQTADDIGMFDQTSGFPGVTSNFYNKTTATGDYIGTINFFYVVASLPGLIGIFAFFQSIVKKTRQDQQYLGGY